MASKYDPFWRSLEPKLAQMLMDSVGTKRPQTLDVSAIRQYGRRENWYGKVTVLDGRIGGGEAAHARALGRTLRGLVRAHPFPGVEFLATISGECVLRIQTVTASKSATLPGPPEVLPAARLRPSPAEDGASGHDLSRAIHGIAWSLRRYEHPIPFDELPGDGIYLQFEDTEQAPGGPRIVRVGINEAPAGLRQRIRNHYGPSRSLSVLRRHVGRALLTRGGAWPSDLARWSNGDAPMADLERRVTEHIERHFSLVCIPVNDREERLRLEQWLVGVLSAWPLAAPSEKWLGRWAGGAITDSGLWNVQHVLPRGAPVAGTPLARLRRLANSEG